MIGFFLAAAMLLIAIAWHRAPEYDEAYSIFLTAGHARPAWPTGVFTAGSVRFLYAGHASFAQIAHDLRNGDVHPPLYFWGLKIWRSLACPSWFAARMLSVLFTLIGLGFLARLAAAAKIPVIPALFLVLLSYGFAYTGITARGFALAQMFNIAGVYLVFLCVRQRRRRALALVCALAGGVAFGAACFTNYLALFTACAAFLWLLLIRPRLLPAALAGFLPFLPACAWFFTAQRHSRLGQFEPFSPLHALALLAKDSGATIFGGLPLYAGHFASSVTLVLGILFLTCIGYVLHRRHAHASLFTLTAIAPPCGLFALGLIFGNTPIEIRYLAFSTPYLALLFAPALPRPLLALMLAVQTCAIRRPRFRPRHHAAPSSRRPRSCRVQRPCPAPLRQRRRRHPRPLHRRRTGQYENPVPAPRHARARRTHRLGGRRHRQREPRARCGLGLSSWVGGDVQAPLGLSLAPCSAASRTLRAAKGRWAAPILDPPSARREFEIWPGRGKGPV
jgi:hypothetical protein